MKMINLEQLMLHIENSTISKTDKIKLKKIIDMQPSGTDENQTPNERVFEKLICENNNGKPYYSIQYIENGERHIGYSSYNLDAISDYLNKYFICCEPIDRT